MALGATPKQVFIDGIAQLKSPHVLNKPRSFQETPHVPDFSQEAKDAVEYEGLPPLVPAKAISGMVMFTNVSSVFMRSGGAGIEEAFSSQDQPGVVVVDRGQILCSGLHALCLSDFDNVGTVVDLKGGSISPGLVSYGSPLGLQEIDQEPSTNDGKVFDPLIKAVPKILGGDTAVVRAVDGLQFATRDAL